MRSFPFKQRSVWKKTHFFSTKSFTVNKNDSKKNRNQPKTQEISPSPFFLVAVGKQALGRGGEWWIQKQGEVVMLQKVWKLEGRFFLMFFCCCFFLLRLYERLIFYGYIYNIYINDIYIYTFFCWDHFWDSLFMFFFECDVGLKPWL